MKLERRGLLYFICCLVILFLLFPMFIIIPMSFNTSDAFEFPPSGFSFQWYANFFGRSDWFGPTILSLRVALLVSLVSVCLGTPGALALVRGKFKGLGTVNAFVLSPMIVPPIIIAVGIYFFFAKLRIIGTEVSLVMAHSILAIPFVVINVSAMLKGLNQNIEQAALNLGANRFQAFFYITLPIIRPGIVSGGILAFITSFDELIIAIFISGSSAVTLPKRMWESLRIETDPTVAAVSSLLIGMSIAILLSVELLRRRGAAPETESAG
jgi:putative spermidine/putrescine transport system permease protein